MARLIADYISPPLWISLSEYQPIDIARRITIRLDPSGVPETEMSAVRAGADELLFPLVVVGSVIQHENQQRDLVLAAARRCNLIHDSYY